MMNAYIIALPEQDTKILIDSIRGTSTNVVPIVFDATTPATLQNTTYPKWNWPITEAGYCFTSGLYKKPYPAKDPLRVEACFVSHYRLWKICALLDESIIILEADALFTRNLDTQKLDDSGYDVVGLNDPAGATRRSHVFHEQVSANLGFSKIPEVNNEYEERSPQGLAGNSAYYITPYGARKMLAMADEFGSWPNDALMCKELLNRSIGVVYPYFTKVQNIKSTTTG
tara:strand:- start:7128 stop:7811 length:684 start_codon:yes stop_codon:yes gene_type:complete